MKYFSQNNFNLPVEIRFKFSWMNPFDFPVEFRSEFGWMNPDWMLASLPVQMSITFHRTDRFSQFNINIEPNPNWAKRKLVAMGAHPALLGQAGISDSNSLISPSHFSSPLLQLAKDLYFSIGSLSFDRLFDPSQHTPVCVAPIIPLDHVINLFLIFFVIWFLHGSKLSLPLCFHFSG